MPLWVRTLLVTALPDDAAPLVDAHRAHVEDLRAEGRLRAAGAFRGGDGFLDIFRAEDLLEAETVARRSPLITEGVAAWSLREWEEFGG